MKFNLVELRIHNEKLPFHVFPFYIRTNFEACSAAVDTMQEVAVDLRDVELLFVLPETEVKEAAQHMIFLKSIHYLREEIRVAGREFSLWKSRLQAIGRAKSKMTF